MMSCIACRTRSSTRCSDVRHNTGFHDLLGLVSGWQALSSGSKTASRFASSAPTFSILSFDKTGRFDLAAYEQPLRARMDLAFSALRSETAGSMNVIEAADRFVDRGGRWEPSRAVARAIEQSALGLAKCERV